MFEMKMEIETDNKVECLVIGVSHLDAKIFLGNQENVEELMNENDGEFIYMYGKSQSRLSEMSLHVAIEALEALYNYDVVHLT